LYMIARGFSELEAIEKRIGNILSANN